MDEQQQNPNQPRRAALVLAAILAATALTGGAAVSGLTRHAHSTAPTAVVQQAPAQQPAGEWEGGD